MSTAESINLGVNGEWKHSYCIQKPDLSVFTKVFDQWKRGIF